MTVIKKAKLFWPLVCSFLIAVQIALAAYFCLSAYFYKNEKFKLAILCSNIAELTKHELATAIFGEPRKFFLFSNYDQESISQKQPEVIATERNTLITINQNSKITVDLQEFKEFVDNILPAHIIYKVLLNKNVIMTKGLSSEQYLYATCSASLDHIVNFSANLSIDKNSEYYQHIKAKFYKKYIIILCLIISIIILCLTYYFLVKNKFQYLEYKNYLLIQHLEIVSKLENLFFNPENFASNQHNEIDALELANDLEHYFVTNQANIKLEVEPKTQHISAFCSEKDFYQLIFSLTNLLIAFMNGQSKQQKSILVILSAEQIAFEFESFTLDEEKMIYLAENVLCLPRSFFLLDCASLFQFLKDHDFKYSIEISEEYNHRFAINMPNKKPPKKSSKILKFRSSEDV